MDGKLYMPVLKWKAGEQEALSNLSSNVKSALLPLIEIMDIPDTRKKIPTAEEYLSTVASDILESWGTETILIDIYDLSENLVTKEGEHFLQYLFERLIEEKVKAVPVISFNQSKPYIDSAIAVHTSYKTGICLRISADDIVDAGDLIRAFQEKNHIKDSDLYVVLDFEYFAANQVGPIALAAVTAIKSITNARRIKFISVCGTSFPESIADIESRSIGEIDRGEWAVWKRIRSKASTLGITPVYGDYSIVHPEIIDFDPVKMKIGGKIKYTSSDEFVIFKGSSLKKDGSEQMHIISKAVTKHEAYKGSKFSWGDAYIAKCAKRECSPGNPKTWVIVGVNHHLTFVVDQISNLSDI